MSTIPFGQMEFLESGGEKIKTKSASTPKVDAASKYRKYSKVYAKSKKKIKKKYRTKATYTTKIKKKYRTRATYKTTSHKRYRTKATYTTTSKRAYTRAASSEDLDDLQGDEGLEKLASYINRNFNHRSGGPHTAEGVERTGYGDCWGLSDWAAKKLAANGYKVKVVQGATSASSRHRWLHVYSEERWTSFEPSLVTKRYGSKHYTATCGRATTVVQTYNM
ncbi:transglutaminase domain-containing protein [Methanothermobacter sp. K4]|uniref:transglutaminase domain-containing protein n=1 Tax=Methanothermobacter sp. K4 TaxID=2913262 RepID=UPI001EDC90F5|nr:transglutaminase domain-containing protein [Methanothermobacter sp. K4]